MPRNWVIALILLCTALNGAGFLWHLFEPIPLYDEIAHFITPFALVAITAEIIYRGGGDDEFFNTPSHAVITGSVIGLGGAAEIGRASCRERVEISGVAGSFKNTKITSCSQSAQSGV